MSIKKPSRTFEMTDVNGIVIGRGKYYMNGGNVQLVYHKFTPDAGALQFHNIGEALLLKGVHAVKWDVEQEDEALTPDGWYKKIKKDDIGWDAEVSIHGRKDLIVPIQPEPEAAT